MLKKRLLLLALCAVAGFVAGLRLPEEKKTRMLKLMREAREVPFRVFV